MCCLAVGPAEQQKQMGAPIKREESATWLDYPVTSFLVEDTAQLMRRNQLIHADEVVHEAAWCKARLLNAPMLGQLVITSDSCIFLCKGQETVPAIVIPLLDIKQVSLGMILTLSSTLNAYNLNTASTISKDDFNPTPQLEPTTSAQQPNALIVTTISSNSSCGFWGFWTAGTLDAAFRWLKFATTKRIEANRETSPPAPRSSGSGSFSLPHLSPHDIVRERSSSAGEVQVLPLAISQLPEPRPKTRRSGSYMQRSFERSTLSRSSIGETSLVLRDFTPRSPQSPSIPAFPLPHSASIAVPLAIRKSMSNRVLETALFRASRSPRDSASPSTSHSSFASPASPSALSGVAELASASNSSSALHGVNPLPDLVHTTLTQLRISTAGVPANIMLGECEGDAQ